MSGDTMNLERRECVTGKDVEELFDYFAKNAYKSNSTDPMAITVMSKTISLMKLDYTLFTIKNRNSELCNHYPSELIFLESPKHENPTIYENLYNSEQLKCLITNSRFARCRARFPMPVIMYKGKYLLRSATLAGPLELNARHIYDTIKSVFGYEVQHISDLDVVRLRSLDVELLESYNVKNIVDLMVEKKKIKYNVSVTSSEKVIEEYGHYGHFNLISLPYPGCEFFSEFRLNNYEAEDLQFDWEQPFIDADLVPPNDLGSQMNINWGNYRKWNLVEMTQNYLKVLLKYMHERKDSTLIHCISGWDRTPMFVSLVRISMWADGIIHQSLTPLEMLYLTVAYDWFLFGHDLPNRRNKNEEIFYFCFYMLKHIEDEEFCINPHYVKNKLLTRIPEHIESKERPQPDDKHGSSLSLNSNASSVSIRSQERNVSPNESLSDDFEHLVPERVESEEKPRPDDKHGSILSLNSNASSVSVGSQERNVSPKESLSDDFEQVIPGDVEDEEESRPDDKHGSCISLNSNASSVSVGSQERNVSPKESLSDDFEQVIPGDVEDEEESRPDDKHGSCISLNSNASSVSVGSQERNVSPKESLSDDFEQVIPGDVEDKENSRPDDKHGSCISLNSNASSVSVGSEERNGSPKESLSDDFEQVIPGDVEDEEESRPDDKHGSCISLNSNASSVSVGSQERNVSPKESLSDDFEQVIPGDVEDKENSRPDDKHGSCISLNSNASSVSVGSEERNGSPKESLSDDFEQVIPGDVEDEEESRPDDKHGSCISLNSNASSVSVGSQERNVSPKESLSDDFEQVIPGDVEDKEESRPDDKHGSCISLNSNASSVSVGSQERNVSPKESLSDDFEQVIPGDVEDKENSRPDDKHGSCISLNSNASSVSVGSEERNGSPKESLSDDFEQVIPGDVEDKENSRSDDKHGSCDSLNSNASSVNIGSQGQNVSPKEWLPADFDNLCVLDIGKDERLQTRGTSPVNMPSARRNRTDSMSSVNSGTWAIISGTGSLRNSDNNFEKVWSTEHCRYVGEEFKIESRVRKLRELRRLMQNAYGKTIGLKFVN